MNPCDYIDFATKLSSSAGGAAEYRSAASRAYYGAFNLAMQFLNDMPHYFPRSQQGKSKHDWVQRMLKNSKVPEAMALGKLLQDAQDDRTDADYELAKRHPEVKTFAEKASGRGELIRAKFTDCRAPALYAKINAGITAHRKLIREIS
jgi:hypothetical protein